MTTYLNQEFMKYVGDLDIDSAEMFISVVTLLGLMSRAEVAS
jgi:hypothetical protein